MAKAKRKNNVPRPRNGGTWTEAKYWSTLRSHVRNAFRYWIPMKQAKEAARRLNQSGFTTKTGKLVKWEYQCAICNQWFPEHHWVVSPDKGEALWKPAIEMDHIVPAGRFNCDEDVLKFLHNLTDEDVSAYQCLCKKCHHEKTQSEKNNRG